MNLQETTELKIKELKSKGIKIDCFSWKREGLPNGEATKDCDYAIDIFSKNQSNIEVGQNSIEIDPYKDGSNIIRLKFKI